MRDDILLATALFTWGDWSIKAHICFYLTQEIPFVSSGSEMNITIFGCGHLVWPLWLKTDHLSWLLSVQSPPEPSEAHMLPITIHPQTVEVFHLYLLLLFCLFCQHWCLFHVIIFFSLKMARLQIKSIHNFNISNS